LKKLKTRENIGGYNMGFGIKGGGNKAAIEAYARMREKAVAILAIEESELKHPENVKLVKEFLKKIAQLCAERTAILGIRDKKLSEWILTEVINMEKNKPSSVESQILHTQQIIKELNELIKLYESGKALQKVY
jgi:hypothetical protein